MIRVVVAACAAAAVLAVPGGAGAASSTSGIVDVSTNLAYEGGAAAGTGMILTPAGRVLTNNHVIRGATAIRVTDPSTGRRYAATVLGYSVTSDVAVLQLQRASSLHTIAVGDSSTVKLGQHVTKVGNAGGAGGTPSSASGSVTGLDRTIVASDGQGLSEQLVGLIKTDAALRPGDSGGALLNASGRVIGMNTAASAGFFFQSASEGYAIPINRALRLVKQIVAGQGSTTVHIGSTPLLGVRVAPAFSGSGAAVVSVVSGSPADRAGIVAGDTIVALGDKKIDTYDMLSALLLRHHAGDSVVLRWVDQFGRTQSAGVRTAAGPPQ